MEESGVAATVVTAGTHVVENQPMSRRTRAALLAVGVDPGSHRSHQLTDADVQSADLIVTMEPEHVSFVRRRYPEAASRTATIRYLEEHLQAGAEPLGDRVAQLHLQDVAPEAQGEIDDPAGKEEPEYIECAAALHEVIQKLAPSLKG